VYLMPPLVIHPADLDTLVSAIHGVLSEAAGAAEL
jgi:adenosylmethionine-8-amino-7-oxononanoate aminotransferase